MPVTQELLRPDLGDFSSIVCTKAIVVGLEDALGEKAAMIALVAAGRRRGKQLAESLGLVNAADNMTMDEIRVRVNEAIGKEGTRLCIVDQILQVGDVYQVHTKETICSAGEPQGSSRTCTYTLGAIQGFLETFLNKRLRGKQTDSTLRGGTHDVLEFMVLE
jgi:predicted hydrocarbon binding protein